MNTALKHRPTTTTEHTVDIDTVERPQQTTVVDRPVGPPPTDERDSSGAEGTPSRRKAPWVVAGVVAVSAAVAAIVVTSSDDPTPVDDPSPAISASPAQQIIQDSIDQGLTERAATSASTASPAQQMVQDSIDQALADLEGFVDRSAERQAYLLIQESIDQGLADRATSPSVSASPAQQIIQDSIDQALADLEGAAD